MVEAIFLAGALARVAPQLRGADFFTEPHRLTYNAMLAIADAGELVDLITPCKAF